MNKNMKKYTPTLKNSQPYTRALQTIDFFENDSGHRITTFEVLYSDDGKIWNKTGTKINLNNEKLMKEIFNKTLIFPLDTSIHIPGIQ